MQLKAEQERLSHPGLRQLSAIQADLRARSGHGGVPARLERGKEHRLLLYGPDYTLSLYPKPSGFYQVGHVGRLTGQEHRKVACGALLLHAPDWHLSDSGRGLPPGHFRTYWEELDAAWERLPSQMDPTRHVENPITHGKDRYLSSVDRLVEAGRLVEINKAQRVDPIPYKAFRTTTEERHSANSVYEFILLRPCPVPPGQQLRIQDRERLRGRIIRLEAHRLTLRFDSVVDHRLIPPTGRLEAAPVENTYYTQKRALAALGDGQTANPNLLSLLVEHRFAPYRPDPELRPMIPLDDAQRDAFTRACAVPDLLLIQGPPGTGKTRTITEIVRACAARGERVLVTSFTNKAVDNVLAALPEQVRSLRVGDEDKLTTFARSRLVEAQAAALQTSMVERIDRDSGRLLAIGEEIPMLRGWLRHAAEQVGEAETTARQAHDLSMAAQQHMERLHAPLRARERELTQVAANCATELDELRPLRDQAIARRDHAAERLARSLLPPLRRWLLRRREARLAAIEHRFQEAARQLSASETELVDLRAHLADVSTTDPVARQIAADLAAANAAHGNALTEADSALARLRRAAASLSQPPALSWHDPGSWERNLAWWGRELEVLRTRSALLNEWRAELHEPAERLHPELIRYADVVAATCLGANAPLLAELDIDVAIIDEAGQISLPTILVPLVRSRRAVLVGDHKQLPPLVEPELVELLSAPDVEPTLDKPELRILLASAFEAMFDTTPLENRVMLREQRRMPESIAEFVSAQFYHGILRTAVRRMHHYPLFTHPFAIVDTSEQPQRDRAETDLAQVEGSRQVGYVNRLEATIITRLIAHAARRGVEWAVIVPYNGQVRLIRDLLVDELGSQRAVHDHVGTVDSFQGGERDLVVYGCTRSNPHGAIGFLSELRRFNVAITRAKEQLVVVGDLRGLLLAKDEEFQFLVKRMAAHVQQHGQILSSTTLLRMLDHERDEHDDE
ncbi:DEAD/DEAH box helicase [Crossiella sp. NPDC003009]